MKNKGGIIALSVLITFFCIYFLSFTYISRSIQKDASNFATTDGKVDIKKKQNYLDSLWDKPVFNFLGAEFTFKDVKQNELNLGLDLQGGMHVVLEVSPVEIIKALSGRNIDEGLTKSLKSAVEKQKRSQENFTTLFYEAFKENSPNKKLSEYFSNSANKGRISFESTDEEVLKIIDEEINSAVGRSLTILRSRIDKFGVSQPNIQQLKGSNRIQVELPGVDNPNRVRKLLQGVAQLEFFEVYTMGEIGKPLSDLNDYLYEKEEAAKELNNSDSGSVNNNETAADLLLSDTTVVKNAETDSIVSNEIVSKSDSSSSDSSDLASQLQNSDTSDSSANDSSNLENAKISSLFKLLRSQYSLIFEVKDTAKVNAILGKKENRAFFPQNLKFAWAAKSIKGDNNTTEFLQLYTLKTGRSGKAPLEGDVIEQAREGIDQNGRGYEITMKMNSIGAKKWRRLTAQNIDRQIAIVLDDNVYSAPTVQGEIPNGSSSISGSFTVEEAKDLSNILKAGSLPAPLRIVEETVVGPSIGQQSINQGLLSILAGLGLVIIFMIAYYSKGGIVANLALLVNIFFIIGILAQFGASLTLPGIAGIVLTIGMSIDANVLIFERIKEEMQMGRKKLAAISMGYSKAYSSIIDSNVTTFLTGLILFYFGSGPVKGFAVTMMIGIGCSFFTAVFISRLFIEWMSKKSEAENLSFETGISKGLLQNVNFNFVGNRKKAYIFSSSLIVLGIVSIFIQGGLNLGVDFTGGRSYVVDFKSNVSPSEIRTLVVDNFENAGTEVKTFGSNNRLKITTSYLSNDESQEADAKVQEALLSSFTSLSDMNPTIQSSSKVGATIADDIKNTSFVSIVFSLIAIFAYIVIRFRRWQFGLGAIIALFHDVLMVVGIFSIVRLLGVAYEVDQVFIAAMLTVIGYSINDTVVVFDRVREYLIERPSADVSDTFNKSINGTLNRTLMTSITTLIVIIILFIFGGEVLRGFSFSLLVGVLFGTYSSIFIATPIVLDTVLKKIKHEKK